MIPMSKKNCLGLLIPTTVIIICLICVFTALIFKVLSPASACQQPGKNSSQPGTSARVITSGGEERCYLLYIPPNYDPSNPIPIVISFHGVASSPELHAGITRWNEIADSENFIVAYPRGTGFPLRWNSFPSAWWSSVDDVNFTRNLIADLKETLAVDQSRIYISGFSNGGAMAHNLACELSDIVAAIGIVSAPVTEPIGGCQPSRAVPVMAFHGTDDLIVNYNGASLENSILGSQSRFEIDTFSYLPANVWTKRWAQRNLCDPFAERLPLRGNASGIRYKDCKNNADVIFYTLIGSGHTWPGGGPLSGRLVGEISTDINASAEMWSFFSDYPLSGVP